MYIKLIVKLLYKIVEFKSDFFFIFLFILMFDNEFFLWFVKVSFMEIILGENIEMVLVNL